ncbi:MAG: ATP-binding protein [Sphaerochaetaceae bacterium]
MDRLFRYYHRRLQHTDMGLIRNLEASIAWDARLIGIKGARGCGKTTLMLQHIKKTFPTNPETALYVSLDNIWFSNNSLSDLIDAFVKRGGTHIFLDEVHKYRDWAIEIKNLYDEFSSLHIVFTCSSLLEMMKTGADIGKRARMYELPGLSFREYLQVETNFTFPILKISDVLHKHGSIAPEIVAHVKPIAHFEQYLEWGYYPYYLKGVEDYPQRLEETVLVLLEQELPMLRSVEPTYVPKLKQMLAVITESAPFVPNITKLSERIGINRQTFITYLNYLEQANLIRLLYRDTQRIGMLQKPDKIFLDNTNLMRVLGSDSPALEKKRETFMVNQISQVADIGLSHQSHFLIDGTYTVGIDGIDKARRQLLGQADAYMACDGLEYGFGQKIPLWLFGFLY